MASIYGSNIIRSLPYSIMCHHNYNISIVEIKLLMTLGSICNLIIIITVKTTH